MRFAVKEFIVREKIKITIVAAFIAVNAVIAALFFSPTPRQPGDLSRYCEPEFWKKQALTEMVPFWEQTIDREKSGFHTFVMNDGSVIRNRGKFPRMISRIAYGYSVAYLLSGDEHYLELARFALDWLYKNGWDYKHGGWLVFRDRNNYTDKFFQKNMFDETYGNLGPVMYYFATHDTVSLSYVKKTHDLIQAKVWDPLNGGYFAEVSPEWYRTVSTKSFNSQMDTCTAYLIYYALATGELKLRDDFLKIADVSREKMVNPSTGFVGETFTDDWKPAENTLWVGHNLKTAWVFTRAYHLSGDMKYLESAERIARVQMNLNWDSRYWGWKFHFNALKPSIVDGGKDWWTQTEGNFLMLNLYRLTGNRAYLDNFMKCAWFWDTYMVDHENLECFNATSPDGKESGRRKAYEYKAMYHSMEHALFNYLYLSFYVKKTDADLYFNLSSGRDGERHYVKIVEDKTVRIKKVEMNGRSWTRFDAKECFIVMPKGRNMKVKVTLGV